jgi:restriction system protein
LLISGTLSKGEKVSSISYSIDVSHDGLHVYRRITGRDRYVVEAKAAAQKAAWAEKWARIQQREKVAYSKEQKKDTAARKTQQAQEAITAIEETLASSLSRNPEFNWNKLKNHSAFPTPQPAPPMPKELPIEPSKQESKYTPRFSVLDHLFSSLKQKKIMQSEQLFLADLEAWRTVFTATELHNSTAASDFQSVHQKWTDERDAFKEEQTARNIEIDEHKSEYLALVPDAVVDYCDFVLSESDYPETFPKSWQLEYRPDNRMLIVEYSLPDIDALPRLKEVKYVVTRNEFTESFLSDSALDKMFDSLLYKITLRTLDELFRADVANALDSIVFNGWVRSIDKATGQETNGCILSIHANKPEFTEINLAKVDPKPCFKKLKGIGSSKLTALVPVRPILQLDTNDARFVPSHDVADGLDDSVNLAAMDWEEFEHLIRELFEKEFSSGESEVKITRASRDGGVDAVVFDPDPLRGGKIVIQAKRYTNTVGLSAVRDLYGTVVNEGANKGILVTTADYGPDAYEFAKDKPLALVSGSNLLHLLEKHGHKARIDLKEAKMILHETGM